MIRCNPRVLPAVIALVVLVACGQNQHAAESAASADMAAADAAAPTVAEEAASLPALESSVGASVQDAGVDPGQLASEAATASVPGRHFVRTAEAVFQVDEVYAAALAIEDAVAAEGGFVVKNAMSTEVISQQMRRIGEGKALQLSEVVTQGTLVVRVPSERTQGFLRTLARQMQFLDARTFQAEDVQFDLLRRQLAQARAQELQREIQAAGAQPGKTGEKVDAVQARESLLAARDDAVVARRELEDRIAFSTLTLRLSQPAQVREQTVPDTGEILRERGPGFFSEIVQALQAGWRGLLAALVVMASLWPLWLCVGVLLLGVRWLLRRRRAGAAAVPPAAS